MRAALDHIEKQLGLGADKHRPILIERAAEILQLKVGTVRRFVNNREIPHYKRGLVWMNKLDEVDLAFSLFTTSSSQSFTSTSTISSLSTLIKRKFKQTKTSRAMAIAMPIKPYVFLCFTFTKIAFREIICKGPRVIAAKQPHRNGHFTHSFEGHGERTAHYGFPFTAMPILHAYNGGRCAAVWRDAFVKRDVKTEGACTGPIRGPVQANR